MQTIPLLIFMLMKLVLILELNYAKIILIWHHRDGLLCIKYN